MYKSFLVIRVQSVESGRQAYDEAKIIADTYCAPGALDSKTRCTRMSGASALSKTLRRCLAYRVNSPIGSQK